MLRKTRSSSLTTCGPMRTLATALAITVAATTAFFAGEQEASAQEIQLTGPLAGAPAVRKLRLHRDGRFEVTPNVSFTLLDEYQRTYMPGLRLQYHFFDWLGLAVWGGYGFQVTTGLADQLQEKAIDQRNCAGNPNKKECRKSCAEPPSRSCSCAGPTTPTNRRDDMMRGTTLVQAGAVS